MTIRYILWRWCIIVLILVNAVIGASLDRGKRDENSVSPFKSQATPVLQEDVTESLTDVLSDPFAEKGPPVDEKHLEASHHERYQVFTFDFNNVRGAYIISLWIFVASVAKLGFHLNNKLSSIFPESCLLILLGIIGGILIYFSLEPNDTESQSQYTLHAATFFQFLLPPIILDAGYFMPNRAFFNNLGTILLYAVVGTLFNTATIGLTLWGASEALWLETQIPLLHCLVFSSLISAVDPVAVLAVFEEIHVNEQLHIVVFGESLLNDAVTVVLYHMFMEYSLQSQIKIIDILAGIIQFFIVGIGGVIIGVIFGVLCAFITKFTSHVRVIEPIFVFLMAYFSYLTAEMFHLSGIMALTFCGIVMKQYVIFNISEKSQTTIKYFLKMLSSMTETVIFMLLGTSTIKDNHVWDVGFIVLTIVSCLIYRALGVLLLTWLANKLRVSKLSFVDQFVMAYGGLRGAIAFALAILLDDKYFPAKNLFVTATILVVMFTVFVQGITIKPLVNALNVRKKHQGVRTMNEQIHERMLDHTMAAIEDITGYRGNHWLRDKWEHYDDKYLKRWLLRERVMTKEHGIMRVHSKLSLKDAMQSVHSGFSVHQAQNGQSLLRLIKNWSVTSFQDQLSSHAGSESDLHHNDTIVDMQALEAHYSKKIADDTKTHHMLQENLLAPRARFTKQNRHTLNEDNMYPRHHHRHDHHSTRYHLRQMISKHQHQLQEKKKQKQKRKEQIKMPKNVSFAQVNELPLQQEQHLQTANIAEEVSEDDDVGGISFTVIEKDEPDAEPPVELVALECELPWKRSVVNQDVAPIPARVSYLLPDDNLPPLAQVPSWADNLDYNNLPALSPNPDIDSATATAPVSSSGSNTGTYTTGDTDDDTTTSDSLPVRDPRSQNASQAEPTKSYLGRALPALPKLNVTNNINASQNPAVKSDNTLLTTGKSDSTSDPAQQKNGPSAKDRNENEAAEASESEDDEEVEIKPFGKLKIHAKGSSPVLRHRETDESLGQKSDINSDDEEMDSDDKGGVMFSIHDDETSDDSTSETK